MILEHVKQWHERARPAVDIKDFSVQLGCHFEEIAEMLEALSFEYIEPTHNDDVSMPGNSSITYHSVVTLANNLKSGIFRAHVTDRRDLLDSLADQVVTGVGVGYCAEMNVPKAVEAVNTSNWSKFVDSYPIFNKQGKISKGPDYAEPDLTGLW